MADSDPDAAGREGGCKARAGVAVGGTEMSRLRKGGDNPRCALRVAR